MESKINYYQTLQKYRPVCYSGKGVPTFLITEKYCSPIACLVVMDVAMIVATIAAAVQVGRNGDQTVFILRNVDILVLIFLNVFFLLTVFLNPGIRGPQDIQEQTVKQCKQCNRMVPEDMKHCFQCKVCVQDLDHHCGFFQKCIAGRQRFAFYGFILFAFVGFMCLFCTLALAFSLQ